MKIVTRTCLFEPAHWFISIMFLLLLPFLAIWTDNKLLASIHWSNLTRGR